MATRFAPVCPQALPPIKKGNPPSSGRQHYMNQLKGFLRNESEDCLYLNIYVPYRGKSLNLDKQSHQAIFELSSIDFRFLKNVL